MRTNLLICVSAATVLSALHLLGAIGWPWLTVLAPLLVLLVLLGLRLLVLMIRAALATGSLRADAQY